MCPVPSHASRNACRWVALLVAPLAAFLLASCGQRDEPDTGPDPGVEEAAEAQAPKSVSITDLPSEFESVWEAWSGDFDGMVERRMVRVLVVFSGHLFYFEQGKPRGVVYETLQEFERFINRRLKRGSLRVQVIPIPVTRDRLIPELLAGHADIAAAALTITADRREVVDFSIPLVRDVSEVIVTGPGAGEISGLDTLSGKDVHVRRSSSYYESLQALNRRFAEAGTAPVNVVLADELLEDEDLLEMADVGLLPITVVDSYKADFWAPVFANVTVRHDLPLRTGGEIAWAIRPDSPQLQAILTDFIRKHRDGTLFGNVVAERYLSDASKLRNAASGAELEKLQPTIALFRKYGEQYRLDWRMLAAMAYQESGLDHDKRSHAGAVGIMQVKPSTAADKNVAIADIHLIENNIEAGAKYLRYVEDKYFNDEGLDELNRQLFAIAAYNAGPSRIKRLRKAAARQGLDPNVWFQNVEIVAARSIGRETVSYVRNVFRYYIAYKLAGERRRLMNKADDTIW
jgi:membrane-bound lytic murein transglycosylase MltF